MGPFQFLITEAELPEDEEADDPEHEGRSELKEEGRGGVREVQLVEPEVGYVEE